VIRRVGSSIQVGVRLRDIAELEPGQRTQDLELAHQLGLVHRGRHRRPRGRPRPPG
jgi:hypothetical protein